LAEDGGELGGDEDAVCVWRSEMAQGVLVVEEVFVFELCLF
jgi:hypothetical protein